ncbi:MAG: Gfo/Idh/MocA family oxidoreductase [Pseudomonadota bacterium]
MSALLTAAVIGCGRMGAFTSASMRAFGPACLLPGAHTEAVAMADGVTLAALCDTDLQNLERAGARYEVDRLYADPAALLSDEAPDLITLATRTPGRADLIERCFYAGARALHVEKPLCQTVAECKRLEQLFECSDLFITLGAIRRHLAVYRRAMAMALSDEYGGLFAAHAEFGARTLYWSHPHSVDLILFAAAGVRVEAVQARLGAVERTGPRIANDPIVLDAAIWFEGGFSGHITRMPGTDWRLACETAQIAVVANGSAIWRSGRAKPAPDAPPPGPEGTSPYHQPERIDFEPPIGPEGALAPIRQLVACLQGHREAIAANAAIKRDIITGQKILFAMVQSHLEGGRSVTLDEIDPAMVIEGQTNGVPA